MATELRVDLQALVTCFICDKVHPMIHNNQHKDQTTSVMELYQF